jgi:7-cyano-7-deazaguanine synthase in queuosine biosynthesis
MPHFQHPCGKTQQYDFDFGRPGKVNFKTAFESEDGITVQYGLDDGELNGQLGALLPPELADLIDIAVAAYVADRLAIREGMDRSPAWHRSVNLVVPVRRLDLWRRADIPRALAEILEFLTEDQWQLQIGRRPSGAARAAESQGHLFGDQFGGPVNVSLLSGGLDSFVGTAAAIAREPQVHHVCVSGVANCRQGDRQKRQVRTLRSLQPLPLTHVRIACWLKRSDEIRQEPTRRTRGFLFLALGAAAAVAARVDRLWLYENGIGALNLPFAHGELGVTTSRSVHPRTLELMGTLVSLIADREFTVRNGSIFQTKAQMCADQSIAAVLDAIPLTFSCDAFPLRRRGATQCGVCTSCLLRRMALWNGSPGHDDAGDYRYDLCAPTSGLDNRHLRGVREMDWQAARITAALAEENAWQGLVSEFPAIARAQQALARQLDLPPGAAAEQLVGLYRRHCEELSRFPAATSARVHREAA